MRFIQEQPGTTARNPSCSTTLDVTLQVAHPSPTLLVMALVMGNGVIEYVVHAEGTDLVRPWVESLSAAVEVQGRHEEA